MGIERTCVYMRAKSLQSRATLYDPIDYSLPASSVPGIIQARIAGRGCHDLQGPQTKESSLCLLPLLHWQLGSLSLAQSWELRENIP